MYVSSNIKKNKYLCCVFYAFIHAITVKLMLGELLNARAKRSVFSVNSYGNGKTVSTY